MINQNKNGSFGKPFVSSGSATIIMELFDLYKTTKEQKYYDYAVKSAKFLLSIQKLRIKDKRIFGGFYETGDDHPFGEALGTRTSAYAMAALLKLENKKQYAYYTA